MPDATCSVQDCDRKPIARGLCTRHYQRWAKFGDPLADHSRKRAICSVDGCESLTEAKGFCGKHYQRYLKYGDPLADHRRRRRPCSVEACDYLAAAKGLCMTHWHRQRNGIPLRKPMRRNSRTDDLAEKLRFFAPPGRPEECWEWTGGLNKGYGSVRVSSSRNRMAHVVAWELANDRSLPPGMVIRHTCDNPPCCNPSHLLLGTHGDNNRDALERNRRGTHPSGYRHLTYAEVRAVRRLHESGVNMTEIARRYNRSRASIMNVVKRRSFADIP